jgi:hypothetical protein
MFFAEETRHANEVSGEECAQDKAGVVRLTQARSGQLDWGCAVFLGGLGKRLGFLLESLEPQIPIGHRITICQEADLHINHCSGILAGFGIQGKTTRAHP